MQIPNHLQSCTALLREKNRELNLICRCTCGNERFRTFRDTLTDAQKRELKERDDFIKKQVGWHSLYGETDRNGKPVLYIKRFWLFKKKLELPASPVYADLHAVRIKCTACGAEHLLFDSRFHGYDASVTAPAPEKEAYEILWQENKDACAVTVSLTYSEEAETPNAFDCIKIYTQKDGAKKRLFFSEETA